MNTTLAAARWWPPLLWPAAALAQSDPLPSWNDCATKKSITDFVSPSAIRTATSMLEWTAAGDGARLTGLVPTTGNAYWQA